MAEILAKVQRGSNTDFSDSTHSKSSGSEEEAVTRGVDPVHE